MFRKEWEYGLEDDSHLFAMLKRATGKAPAMEQTKQLVELVGEIYRPGMRVLDVCCGAGHFYPALESIDKNIIYHGCDISIKYIAAARETFKEKANAGFFEGNIFNLPFPDNSYDIVFCYTTIQHFPDYREAVRELLRVTAKHLFMRLLLSDHTYIIKRFKKGLLDEKEQPAFVYYNIWNESEFVDYLESNLGCREVKVYDDRFNVEIPKVNNWDTYTLAGMQISGNIILTWKHVRTVKGVGLF